MVDRVENVLQNEGAKGELLKYLTPIQSMLDIDPRAGKIVEICARAGYHISLEDATAVWRSYSDMFSAGWIGTDNEEEVVAAVVARCYKSGE